MIDIHALIYRYPRATMPLFADFSWQIAAGEHWTIIGPSGCGKTTLLKLMAGLIFPHAGHITIQNQPVRRPRPETGLILQDHGLLPWATVWNNVALGLRIRRFYGRDAIHTPQHPPLPTRSARRRLIRQWLERLHIWEQRHQFPTRLSGGQRQRVAIARTLVLQPDLLLMDEPFNSLDALIRERLQDVILEWRAALHMTTVIVTHAIDEAAILGSRILVLGKPPHHTPRIIENPAAEDPDYRQTAAYLTMRNTLREVIGFDEPTA